MKSNRIKKGFAVCVKNEGYEVSLELRKIYKVLPDAKAETHQMVRVVDESEEDYLYPADWFVSIDVPKPLKKALTLATAAAT